MDFVADNNYFLTYADLNEKLLWLKHCQPSGLLKKMMRHIFVICCEIITQYDSRVCHIKQVTAMWVFWKGLDRVCDEFKERKTWSWPLSPEPKKQQAQIEQFVTSNVTILTVIIRMVDDDGLF